MDDVSSTEIPACSHPVLLHDHRTFLSTAMERSYWFTGQGETTLHPEIGRCSSLDITQSPTTLMTVSLQRPKRLGCLGYCCALTNKLTNMSSHPAPTMRTATILGRSIACQTTIFQLSCPARLPKQQAKLADICCKVRGGQGQEWSHVGSCD